MYKPRTMRGGVGLRIGLLACGLATLAAGGAACTSDGGGGTGPQVTVGPTLLFPRGVFDNVRSITLKVFDATNGVDCGDNGAVTGPAERAIATKELQSQGCEPGVKFCGQLVLGQSDAIRVFHAQGLDGAGTRLADGCSKAVVNQDSMDLEIKMRRFIRPAICDGKTIDPKEQCERGDPICNSECKTTEVELSRAREPQAASRDHGTPFFLWPAARGNAGKFVAFFASKAHPQEVSMRVLSDSFGRYDVLGNEVADFPFFLPNDSADPTFPPKLQGQNQSAPSAAFLDGKYFVAYQDDARGTLDIRLRSMTTDLRAEQTFVDPININGAVPENGEDGDQTRPAIALGAGSRVFFIAWEDNTPTPTIRGRTFEPNASRGTLGPTVRIGSGADDHHVSLAALEGAGDAKWVAAWESGTDVKVQLLGGDGSLLGSEITVNDSSHSGRQNHPAVAAIPGGRFAVVWNDRGRKSGDIFVQRYTVTSDAPIALAGDQLDPINDLVFEGEQLTPTIAAAPSTMGGSYVAAWVNLYENNHVRARFLGGNGGFLFNHVDGQETEFQASSVGSRRHANPTIAVGGATPFVAIGWEDVTDEKDTVIRGRRFPVGE